MTSNIKYVGMDVHKESISIAVRNAAGKIVIECVIETKASTILQFFDGLRGEVQVTFEEGTWAAWLYDLLKPHVAARIGPTPTAMLKGTKWSRRRGVGPLTSCSAICGQDRPRARSGSKGVY